MTRETLLAEIAALRSTLLLMDTVYRTGRNKSTTPVEIASTLKDLRMLQLSAEVGGLHQCFEVT